MTEEARVGQRRNDLARVAHELGGALAPARSALDLLRSGHAGVVAPETEHWLHVAVRGLARAERILDNLTAVAVPESARIRPESVHLPSLLADLAAEFDAYARSREVRLEVEAPPELSIPTDRFALEQVLANLVSNAIKFSHAGGTVILTAEAPHHGVMPGRLALLGGVSKTAPHCVRIGVRDCGPGLAEETRQRLFEPFFRGAEAQARRLPGLGLGLAVARSSVALLHGDLRLDPTWRSGCHFVVTLAADASTLERIARLDDCYAMLQARLGDDAATLVVLQGPAVFEPSVCNAIATALQREVGDPDAAMVALSDTTAVACTRAPVRRTWRSLGRALAGGIGTASAAVVCAGVQRVRRGASPDESVLCSLVRCRFKLPIDVTAEVRAS